MLDGRSGNTIEKSPRGGGTKQSGNPIMELEPVSLEEIKHVLPSNGVKGFTNVALVKSFCKVDNITTVVSRSKINKRIQ
jgi:hypothetical protein